MANPNPAPPDHLPDGDWHLHDAHELARLHGVNPDLKDLVVACNLNSPRRVSVSLRDGWSEAWPQSAHLLREEANAWQRTPWSLQILQS